MKAKFLKLKSLLMDNPFFRRNLILTVVALIEVIAIMVVSTSAWVETISTVQIGGDEATGKISAPIFTTAKFDGTSKELDLSKYFNASGNVHLASASSTDGKNIFFPKLNTTPIKYRKGTVNDINVNYISFSVMIDATQASGTLNFFFNKIPEIKIGSKLVNDSSVRLAISKKNAAPKIFAKGESASEAVISEDGTMGTTFAKKFDDYVQLPNKDDQEPIFDVEYGKTEEVTFTLWLEDPEMNNAYTGQTVTVNDLFLVTDTKEYTVSFVDRTTAFYNGGTGNGLYWVENKVGNEDAQMWVYCAGANKSIKMSQAADDPTLWSANLQEFLNDDTSDLYFLRTSKSASAPASQNASSVQNSWKTKLSEDTLRGKTYTAYSNVANNSVKFGTWGKVTEILLDTESTSLPKPENGKDYTAADISLKVNNVTYEMNYKNIQSGALWRCYIPTEKLSDALTFSFKRDNTTYTYNADKRGNSLRYVITSSNTGYWEPPATIQIITESPESGTALGTATASVGSYSGTTIRVTPGTAVTLNSSNSDNYRFMGWYHDATYLSSAEDVIKNGEFTPSESKTYTFYAKFQRQYHITLTAVTGSSYPDSTGGTVQLYSDGVTASATNKVDKFLLKDGTENNNVKFTAKISVPDGYEFLGWFDNSSGTGTPVKKELEYNVGTVDRDYTLYAKFMPKEFKVTAVAKPTNQIGGSKVTFSEPTGASVDTEVDVKVLYNNKAIFVAKPDKANGYEFVGWYTDPSLADEFKIDKAGETYETTILKETILYAKFKLKDVTLTAKAVTGTSESADGGTVKITDGKATAAGASDSKTVQYGSSVTLTANPNNGYEFKGWYTSATGGSAVTGIANDGTYTDETITLSSVKADATVYARFEKSSVESDYYLMSIDNNWTNGRRMTYTDSTKKFVTYTLDLNANSTYEFKIKYGGTWYTNNTTFTVPCINADFNTEGGNNNNAKVNITKDGAYTFTFDVDNKKLSITADGSGGDTVTYYFTNNYKWSKVCCYAWNSSNNANNGSYPGVTMTWVENNGQGEGVYKVELDSTKGFTHLIFSNGGTGNSDKTIDIKISSFNENNANACYINGTVSGGSDNGKYTVGYWNK